MKVKDLTPGGTHVRLEKTIGKINSWHVGWSSYYCMTQYPTPLVKIEMHIIRRLCARLIDQQKSKRNLFKKLVKCDVPHGMAAPE